MMTCLCADPPTCVRGEVAHNQAIAPTPPTPPSPPPGSAPECTAAVESIANACVGVDRNGNPVGQGCAGCIDRSTVRPQRTFLDLVRDASGQSCMMPEGMLADEMMTCLC